MAFCGKASLGVRQELVRQNSNFEVATVTVVTASGVLDPTD
jgi:hypothetical protein